MPGPPPKPNKPTNLKVCCEPDNLKITMTWDGGSGAYTNGVEFERQPGNKHGSQSDVLAGIEEDHTYVFKIRSYGPGGYSSGWGTAASCSLTIPKFVPPEAPTTSCGFECCTPCRIHVSPNRGGSTFVRNYEIWRKVIGVDGDFNLWRPKITGDPVPTCGPAFTPNNSPKTQYDTVICRTVEYYSIAGNKKGRTKGPVCSVNAYPTPMPTLILEIDPTPPGIQTNCKSIALKWRFSPPTLPCGLKLKQFIMVHTATDDGELVPTDDIPPKSSESRTGVYDLENPCLTHSFLVIAKFDGNCESISNTIHSTPAVPEITELTLTPGCIPTS